MMIHQVSENVFFRLSYEIIHTFFAFHIHIVVPIFYIFWCNTDASHTFVFVE